MSEAVQEGQKIANRALDRGRIIVDEAARS